MRAGVFERPGTITMREVDDPSCGAGDLVIDVAQCGVCGTDRSIFRGEYVVARPVILGHEYTGTVTDVGSSVTGFDVGDRVVVDPNVVDDVCFYCRRGQSHLCTGLSALGVDRNGGFAERSAVPARYAHKIPDGLSFADAVLIEPLACCIRGIDQANVTTGDVVVICGAGPIGCLLMQLARMNGAATVVAVEPSPSRHDGAVRAGADVVCTPREVADVLQGVRGSVGADVVIEASGSMASAATSFDLVRRGGTVLLFGVYPQDQTMPVSPFRINEDELRVVGSLNNPSTHSRALELMTSGRLALGDVVSHRLPLDELTSAMSLDNFANPGKIVIELLAG